MADDKQNDSATVYYRSDIAGLTVYLGVPLNGDVAPESARFVPFYERVNGDDSKVGYLSTDDLRVIDKCDNDFHCTRINTKEFKEATTEKFDEAGNTLGARRAAY